MHQQDLYARLELLTPSDVERQATIQPVTTQPQRDAITVRFGRWGKALLTYFLGSREPQILTKRDHDGHIYYVVFDPIDQRRHTFSSEHDVRTWLDKRYYQ